MKQVKFLAAFMLMFILSITANAQQASSRVQQRRIEQGTRSGEITRHERRQLERQQRNTRRNRRYARADSVVTPRERREIKRQRRHANRNIYRKKHNRRDRI